MSEFSVWSRDLVVTGDGQNLVSHTGTAAVRLLADRVGLTDSLVGALAQPRLLVHDRGRVFGDLAVAIADGADTIDGIKVLGSQPELFGTVASTSTTWRMLDEVAAGGQPVLDRVASAIGRARELVWDQIVVRHGVLPPIRVADRQIRGMTGIRIDATLINVHTDKELAGKTFKKGFGFHPLLAYCDNTNESLAQMLRTGSAGSNDAEHHTDLVDAAVAAVPAKYRRRLLVTVDGAGASGELVKHLDAMNREPGRQVWYTIGWSLTERERQAIGAVTSNDWVQAIDADGKPRTSRDANGTIVPQAHVAEITELLREHPDGDKLKNWPGDMRVIVRRELPHHGAQLSLFEEQDGYRYQLFATNIANQPEHRDTHVNGFLQHLPYLDALYRSHARVEDRIRTGKTTGLRFPSHSFTINQAWLAAALLAATLLAWFALLALDEPLAKAEPRTIRYRLLHVAARLTRGQRRHYLKIDQNWAWTPQLVTAFTRIQALPAGP